AVGQHTDIVVSYNVVDGKGGVTPQSATITITGTNDAPVLTADAVSLTETSATDAVSVPLQGTGNVLVNDSDAESDTLSVVTIRPFSPNPVAFSPVLPG